jgi:hypothetical protein
MQSGNCLGTSGRSGPTGSVYRDLLQQVVAAETESADRSVADLVALVLARRRVAMAESRPEAGVASRLSDALSYDAALVQLCDRLGVCHDLVGPNAGPSARRSAEQGLAERLPAVAAAVINDDPSIQ